MAEMLSNSELSSAKLRRTNESGGSYNYLNTRNSKDYVSGFAIIS